MSDQPPDRPSPLPPAQERASANAVAAPAAERWTVTSFSRRSIPLVLPVLIVAGLDRISKLWISVALWDPPRNVVIVPGWLELTPVANRGIAFGLLQETGGLLAVLTVTVLGGMALWKWRQLLAASMLVRIALGMIAGGAIGNMIDRAQLGYVIDFLHVPHIGIFQVFNVSDASIVVGTAVLTIALGPIAPKRPSPPSPTPSPGGS